jgi:acetyl-CoA C-acetyltransferase
MREAVIIDAVRTPFGKRSGALSSMHSADLLGLVLTNLIERTGIDPHIVDQVIGGCVGQVGMQAANVTRTAWLAAGLPIEIAATTVDAQCGSSQQASSLAHGLIASGLTDVVIACGVEIMSRVPMGSTVPRDGSLGKAINRNYWRHHEYTTQFEGAERLADRWNITRVDCDRFGKESQDRAALAWEQDRFASQLVPVEVPEMNGQPGYTVAHDEGPRPTTLDALATLKPTGRPDGVHTAGTSSQIADGASALLMMSSQKAAELGLEPMAAVVDSCLIGSDPVLMLTGPIVATQRLLTHNKLVMSDIDVVEINEAFASVVLAWERELKPDMATVNPNGGAIALGHPLGATGVALIAKAVHEMVRSDKEVALVTMCCGGGLGTGTLLRR